MPYIIKKGYFYIARASVFGLGAINTTRKADAHRFKILVEAKHSASIFGGKVIKVKV